MDIYFNSKFNKILSLGSNCYPKFFIGRILKPVYGQTELFDYIGTSMWAINMLLLNDFAGLTDIQLFDILPILEGEEPIVTNTKYYMRFIHDLKKVSDSESVEFQEKIKRRIQRFKENMSSFDRILFIRRQEIQKGRIHYNGGLKRPERDELDDFIDILHIKYKCRGVTIIYINLEEDGWNDRGDILCVKAESLGCEREDPHNVIMELFEKKHVIESLEKRFLKRST
jgi:hypothetical protein